MTLEQAIRILHPESDYECPEDYQEAVKVYFDATLLACEVMQREVEGRKGWNDASVTPPPQDGLYYGKKDETNSMYPVRFESGKWTLSNHSDRKVDIKQWAYWDAFDGDDTCPHCGKPLNEGKVDGDE